MRVLTFVPLFKQTIWGGDKILPFKHSSQSLEQVGESWEISGLENNETVVADGEYEGRRLNDVVAELKGRLVGNDNYKRFGNRFPLLIKFIDACRDLSIQVHPDDETAGRHGHPNGKTEMWYMMKSEPGAKILLGLKQHITPEEYKDMVRKNTICDAITEYEVNEGDCFFIPAGRIHSTGKGCFFAEIQQTSDVTYRIYDFNRKDKDGNLRELHTEKAAESIDYEVKESYKTDYTPVKNEGVQIVESPLFNTAVYDIDEPMTLDYSELDSFVILIGLKGEGTLTDEDGNETIFGMGKTLLIPAEMNHVNITGDIKFLETYI